MYGVQVQELSTYGRTGIHRDPQREAAGQRPTIFVIVTDSVMRASLEAKISSAGWKVQTHASAAEFLSSVRQTGPGCVILDVALPDFDGLDLQEHLKRNEPALCTVFLMKRPDVPAAVRAMRAGAVDVFTDPVDDETLLHTIDEAADRSRAALAAHSELVALRRDYTSLTPREREVMMLVTSGRMNKQVGGDLGISEITVKAHRGSVMRKMKARSFAELVGKASQLGL